MTLEKLPDYLTICKVAQLADLDLNAGFFFIGRTDEELSLVCRTEDAPEKTLARDDGWRGFRIRGTLDFSLVGILSRLSGILAAQQIGIFAVSTYNTDYILVREAQFERALEALASGGYAVESPAEKHETAPQTPRNGLAAQPGNLNVKDGNRKVPAGAFQKERTRI